MIVLMNFGDLGIWALGICGLRLLVKEHECVCECDIDRVRDYGTFFFYLELIYIFEFNIKFN